MGQLSMLWFVTYEVNERLNWREMPIITACLQFIVSFNKILHGNIIPQVVFIMAFLQ